MIAEELRAQLGDAVQSAEEAGRELRLRVRPSALVQTAQACKRHGFTYPADITAIDTGTDLRVVYRLISMTTGEHLVISVAVPRSGARLPTITGVYHGAEWAEREVYDLFGVSFDGHPNLSRILLTDDWKGHPLLKPPPQGA